MPSEEPKPKHCVVVEVNAGSLNSELMVCAPDGYVMMSATGAWYRNLSLVPDPMGQPRKK